MVDRWSSRWGSGKGGIFCILRNYYYLFFCYLWLKMGFRINLPTQVGLIHAWGTPRQKIDPLPLYHAAKLCFLLWIFGRALAAGGITLRVGDGFTGQPCQITIHLLHKAPPYTQQLVLAHFNELYQKPSCSAPSGVYIGSIQIQRVEGDILYHQGLVWLA